MNRITRAVLTALTVCAVVVGAVLVAGGGSGTASAAPSSSDVNALSVAASPATPGVTGRRLDRRERREVIFALLPDALQADLKQLWAAPKDQRPALRAEIWKKALAGDYGTKVQDAAKKLQEYRSR